MYDNTIFNDDMDKMKEIYFAGGCFWGTEHFFSIVHGVTGTETGYANSRIASPSYREVCSGATGAAETVKVIYLPGEVSLGRLIELYMLTIDPTSVNRQGNAQARNTAQASTTPTLMTLRQSSGHSRPTKSGTATHSRSK